MLVESADFSNAVDEVNWLGVLLHLFHGLEELLQFWTGPPIKPAVVLRIAVATVAAPKCPVLEPVPLVVLLITSLGARKANIFLERSQFNLNCDFVPRWDRQQRGIRFASSDVLKTRTSLDLFVESEPIQSRVTPNSSDMRSSQTLVGFPLQTPFWLHSKCSSHRKSPSFLQIPLVHDIPAPNAVITCCTRHR